MSTGGAGRFCAPLTKCQLGYTFEAKKKSGADDRVCAPVRRCVPGYEFETKPASLTEDRVCTKTKRCEAYEFEVKAATPKSNPVCQKATVCTASQFENAPLKTSEDRKCTLLTDCGSTEYAKVPATATSQRQCAALTTCSNGEAIVVDATPTSDRKCEKCKAGSYLNSKTGKCSPVSTCGRSEVIRGTEKWRPQMSKEVAPATATADTQCEFESYVCPAGYWTAESKATKISCQKCTACTSSEVNVAACLAGSDRKCETRQSKDSRATASGTTGNGDEPRIRGLQGNLVIERPLFVQGSELSVSQQLLSLAAKQAEVDRLNDDLNEFAQL